MESGKGLDPSQNFVKGTRTDLTSGIILTDVRADDVVAEKSGFGSGKRSSEF